MIEVGCLTSTKEKAAYDGGNTNLLLSSKRKARKNRMEEI